jgi:hypothetical protein
MASLKNNHLNYTTVNAVLATCLPFVATANKNIAPTRNQSNIGNDWMAESILWLDGKCGIWSYGWVMV